MASLSKPVLALPSSFAKENAHFRIRTNKSPIVSCSSRDKNGSSFSGFSLQKFEGNVTDILQVPFPSPDKGSVANPNDIMQLFNDAQQNILYLNKQRLTAMEELKKVHSEKELLLARLGQLEVESQSIVMECEVLKQKLNLMESAVMTRGILGLQKSKKLVKSDPPSIFSEMLLRIDSMALLGVISTTQASDMRSLIINKDYITAEAFYDLHHKNDKELAAGLLPLLDAKRRRRLHIVQICTEMAPITEGGSVASHVTGLCRALRRRSNLVEVILPKYACIDLKHVQGLQEVTADFYSYFGGQWHRNKIWTGVIYGIAVTFIEPLHPSSFFEREHLYGYDDDFERSKLSCHSNCDPDCDYLKRFTYFSRASLEYLVKSGKQPDILHLHNWQTAVVAPLFWDIFVHQGLGSTRILFTCHDFESQCVQESKKLGLCGLDPHQLHRPDRLQDNFEPRLVNLLKGGIVYSNKVTTISATYAKDVMTKEHGHGLDSTLVVHKDKFMGIPYGFDDTLWNPMTDKFLPATYSVEDLTGKSICKVALRRHAGLLESQRSTPLVGCVHLDISDKELEFIKSTWKSAVRKGAQFILVGASKIPRVQAALDELQKDLKKEDGRVIDKYNEGILHLVIAGCDILLCSSFHDPSHQMPLKALKYGTVPIARKVDGGYGRGESQENKGYNLETMSLMFYPTNHVNTTVSLMQALDQMIDDPIGWNELVKSGMMKDFSWDADCVEAYMTAYWHIHQL